MHYMSCNVVMYVCVRVRVRVCVCVCVCCIDVIEYRDINVLH